MTGLEECTPRKHEDLSLDSRQPHESQMGELVCDPGLLGRERGISETRWLASLAELTQLIHCEKLSQEQGGK